MSDIRIQDDLYEYVNGDWLKTAVIPDDKPTTGGFALLAEEVEKNMMADFEKFASGELSSDIDSVNDAIRLYKKVLDKQRRDEEGIKPLLPLLREIKEISTLEQLQKKAFRLNVAGVPLPFEYGVDTDMNDARKNCLILQGPAIILPDTTYYGTENGERLLGVYRDMAEKLLTHTELSEEERKQYLEDTITFDGLVAKAVKSQLEWSDYVKCYNPIDLEKAQECLKPLDFKTFLKEIYEDKMPDMVIAYDLRAIEEFNTFFNEDNLEIYLHWAYVKTLLSNAAYLSLELATLSTSYRRTLIGVDKDADLDKKAYQVASNVFSEPVGIYYGRTYFGEEAKKDVVEMVKKIIETYKRRVKENTFLEESTKEKAIKKLSTINIKMGYPDEADSFYKQMKVDENDSYYTAMKKINEIRALHNLGKLHKGVDRNEWMMPGHMVNACYDPSRNDITFPAAILQKPFYSLKQTLSENLGGIGAVIAHEISHAFDNNGSHFDENGNLFNWWSEKDFAEFDKLTKLMEEQWDGIPYGDSAVNGKLVVSENIADNGGMAVAIDIMHQSENTDFELFFKNWAKVWCMKAKPEYINLLLKNDVHSPAKLRANVQVRNFNEWYDTFEVTKNDQMYIAPEKRIIIW